MRLVRKEFRAWLEGHKNARVGWRGDPSACPLAEFVTSRGYTGVGIHPYDNLAMSGFARIGRIAKMTLLPKWANDFSLGVDKSGADGSAITASRALKILDEPK